MSNFTIPYFEFPNLEKSKFSKYFSIFYFSNYQIFKTIDFSNSQLFNFSKLRIYEFSNVPILQPSNEQSFKRSSF